MSTYKTCLFWPSKWLGVKCEFGTGDSVQDTGQDVMSCKLSGWLEMVSDT